MRARGYTTVGVTVNPWTHDTGFEIGFDQFLGLKGTDAVESRDRQTIPFRALNCVLSRTDLGDKFQWGNTKDWFVQWPHYYNQILDALEGVGEPYFLWVFILDPHQPYLAPGDHRMDSTFPQMYYSNFREFASKSDTAVSDRVRRWLKQSYRDTVRSTDAFLNELYEDLAADNPAFVVHADHGEAFGEHDSYGHEEVLYEENLHVPLVVANGEVTGSFDDPVSLRSLPRIIESVASGTFDAGAVTQEWVQATTEGVQSNAQALRGRRWKYIRTEESQELYDLRSDLQETKSLAASKPDIVGEMDRILNTNISADREANAIGAAVEGIEISTPDTEANK
jgi:arylsulfatase A-like enzyme